MLFLFKKAAALSLIDFARLFSLRNFRGQCNCKYLWWTHTSQPQFRGCLSLLIASGYKALIHSIIFSLKVENLQCLPEERMQTIFRERLAKTLLECKNGHSSRILLTYLRLIEGDSVTAVRLSSTWRHFDHDPRLSILISLAFQYR